jgi:hypothetical protein
MLAKRLSKASDYRASWAAVLVAVCASIVLAGYIDYPLGTSPDEPYKVRAVLTGESQHYHPLLMINIARAINAVMGLAEPQSIVVLGRVLSCIFSGLLIVATWQLARRILPETVACAAAAASAVLPLSTTHALIFKEDAFVAPMVVFSVAALIRLIDRPTTFRALALGASIGMAGSAKYVGGLVLLPFAVAVLLLIRPGDLAHAIKMLATAVLVAAAVVAIVQMPAFLEWHKMIGGIQFEWSHVFRGHDVPIPISRTGGIFHLRESLWPGMGTALLALGLAGLASPFVASPSQRLPCAIVVAFTLLWYAVHEITPLRPYPDFSRYMLPIGPLFVLNGAAFIYYLARRLGFASSATVSAGIILIAAIPALLFSVQIINTIGDDPRRVVSSVIKTLGHPATFDAYTTYDELPPFTLAVFTSDQADLLVTSSLRYERFARHGADPSQPQELRKLAQHYKDLLSRPHLEVESGGRHFAFFNPLITVVVHHGSAARLEAIAAALREVAPRLRIELVDGAR